MTLHVEARFSEIFLLFEHTKGEYDVILQYKFILIILLATLIFPFTPLCIIIKFLNYNNLKYKRVAENIQRGHGTGQMPLLPL